MTEARGQSVWAGGAEYETYVGRWSRPVAVEFVNWLSITGSSLVGSFDYRCLSYGLQGSWRF